MNQRVAYLALGFAALLAACGPRDNAAMNGEEVTRLASPDAVLDAVLVEHNPGATASYDYGIYVLAHGAKPAGPPMARLYGATRNLDAYGVDLRWQGPDVVLAEYSRAKSVTPPAGRITVDQRKVRIVLREGVENPSALAGGMAAASGTPPAAE